MCISSGLIYLSQELPSAACSNNLQRDYVRVIAAQANRIQALCHSGSATTICHHKAKIETAFVTSQQTIVQPSKSPTQQSYRELRISISQERIKNNINNLRCWTKESKRTILQAQRRFSISSKCSHHSRPLLRHHSPYSTYQQLMHRHVP